MKISRLRLSGFKSFVEQTELQIDPGLTGIVGPNGCGKSNLLEALRWVMGENSPKSMRGSGMEDVIFAGTNARPSRNWAEVGIVLDNAARAAPAAFNDSELLEVSRRIERELGSTYRVNGREVRARDVQLMFADASTGAHSPALVKQGQIGQLINAKPQARRMILEEAAGISGLHSRRHEAELKLRAAETNLARLTDIIQEIEGQLANLRKQARQAARYRNLSGLIRRAESIALHLRWSEAAESVARTEAHLAQAAALVGEATQAAAQTATAQAEAQTALPPLREAEAMRAAALHRLTLERDLLDAEEARALETARRLELRLAQTREDAARETAQAADAQSHLTQLAETESALAAEQDAQAAREAEAAQAVEALRGETVNAESRLDALTAEAAELAARRSSLERALADAEGRLRRLAAELARAQEDHAGVAAEARASDDTAAAREAVEAAKTAAERARTLLTEADRLRSDADRSVAEARAPLEASERDLQRLRAEAKALAGVLGQSEPGLWPALIDSVKVAPGLEAALGAALGEDLDAPLDANAPMRWTELGPLDPPQALPDSVEALSAYVEAPDALQRRLSQIGLVAAEDGAALQHLLKPGQRLVSRAGDLWRWDGFTAAADAPSAAAVRLEQRNRLRALDAEIAQAETAAATARAAFRAVQDAADAARQAEHGARQDSRGADQSLAAAQEALNKAERAAAAHASRLAALEEAEKRIRAALAEADDAAVAARTGLAGIGGEDELRTAIAGQREATATLRGQLAEARAAHEGLAREAQARARRLAEIGRERVMWSGRIASAQSHIAALEARIAETGAELDAARAVPAQTEAKRQVLLGRIGEAETARAEAADALAAAERRLAECERAARTANAVLSEAREERARLEATAQAQQSRLAEIVGRIAEAMDCEPQQLLARAEIGQGEELPPLEQIESRVEKLKRERENLGGVNLRAEEEAEEHQQRLDSMTADRADLEGAIAKLRGGISELNREGRERLLGAFDKVNTNFKKLFTTLFGGGEAELTLTESDDPLEAGLEILARPPGKKLTTMSLLSGGEQALTALSLIFAVFLTNPAPICVLDEVDAPLDDANVERFCNLLDEMTRMTETRFLVITHHALTMSRMDRLYGVTMAERGVSQLVSVDLAGASQVLAAE